MYIIYLEKLKSKEIVALGTLKYFIFAKSPMPSGLPYVITDLINKRRRRIFSKISVVATLLRWD